MRLPIDTGAVKFAAADTTDPERSFIGKVPSLLVSVEQAAAILGIGRTRTFELVMGYSITSVKIGRRRLVVRSSLEEFVQRLVETQDVSEDNSGLDHPSNHGKLHGQPSRSSAANHLLSRCLRSVAISQGTSSK